VKRGKAGCRIVSTLVIRTVIRSPVLLAIGAELGREAPHRGSGEAPELERDWLRTGLVENDLDACIQVLEETNLCLGVTCGYLDDFRVSRSLHVRRTEVVRK
ncbi:MAG: hypothetical protein RL022_583, partial [Chloroflexota bacterium]